MHQLLALNLRPLITQFSFPEPLDFIIQHCVGEYPTPTKNMNLNQIDYLRQRHPEVQFGFSTHEDPSDTRLVQMAVAKGAVSFEKHVGIPTVEWPLNLYSADLDQTRTWLLAAREAKEACGELTKRYEPTSEERNSLQPCNGRLP